MTEVTIPADPKPGSDAALAAGCTCPSMDNHYGAGHCGNGATYGWWITEGCPLHHPLSDAGGSNAGE